MSENTVSCDATVKGLDAAAIIDAFDRIKNDLSRPECSTAMLISVATYSALKNLQVQYVPEFLPMVFSGMRVYVYYTPEHRLQVIEEMKARRERAIEIVGDES